MQEQKTAVKTNEEIMIEVVRELNERGHLKEQAYYEYPGYVGIGNYAFGIDEEGWSANTLDGQGIDLFDSLPVDTSAAQVARAIEKAIIN